MLNTLMLYTMKLIDDLEETNIRTALGGKRELLE